MNTDARIKPTVLVVDDSDDYRSALRLWLETRNLSVIEAENGMSALEMARANRPDLVLMDIGLPERSGISTAYLFRKESELRDIPIVVITGFENEDLHREAIKAGCVECLTKPVDTGYLMNLIERLLDAGSYGREASG